MHLVRIGPLHAQPSSRIRRCGLGFDRIHIIAQRDALVFGGNGDESPHRGGAFDAYGAWHAPIGAGGDVAFAVATGNGNESLHRVGAYDAYGAWHAPIDAVVDVAFAVVTENGKFFLPQG